VLHFFVYVHRFISVGVVLPPLFNTLFPCVWKGQDNSVGIATRYGLDGPGFESRCGEILRTRPEWPWGPPSLLYNGYRLFPGVQAAGAWR
jgi:hypothetical protein